VILYALVSFHQTGGVSSHDSDQTDQRTIPRRAGQGNGKTDGRRGSAGGFKGLIAAIQSIITQNQRYETNQVQNKGLLKIFSHPMNGMYPVTMAVSPQPYRLAST
jgi:hypothetical protein